MSHTILTNIGLATIAAVTSAGGSIQLSHMAVGDANGNDTDPDPNQSSLIRETYRATLNHLAPNPTNPNEIIAELVIPVEVGGFVVREVGLFDTTGNLIAVGSYPAAVKPLPSSGAMSEMVIRLVIAVSNTADFELVVDPTIVIATRQWCQDSFTLAIQLPGGATGQVLRKSGNANGAYEWYDPATGMTILVHSIEENQTLAASQTLVTLAIATTTGAAVFIDGKRLRSDEWSTTSNNQITLTAPATAGARITILQNEQLASADFLRSQNLFSEINAAGSIAQKTALQNLGLADLDALAILIHKKQYPVGATYLHTQPTDPALILGFGTWQRIAKGHALVGVDENDPDFNAAEKAAGSKTVTLTTAQLPKHKVTIPEQTLQMNQVGDHVHSIPGSIPGGNGATTRTDALASLNRTLYARDGCSTNAAGAHTPTGKLPSCQSNEVGSDQAHNNLQPSLAIYIWKRTA